MKDFAVTESKDPPPASPVIENPAHTPFCAEELIDCWNTCSETLEEEIYLKNTMINCKPVLLDQFHFEVKVHNPVQREALLNASGKLLQFMRSKLKNSLIQMHIRIDETNEKQLTYTSTERYEYLYQINPALSRLISEFDLIID